nr:acetate/propionate family kinase [Arthrobacter sp. 35W]
MHILVLNCGSSTLKYQLRLVAASGGSASDQVLMVGSVDTSQAGGAPSPSGVIAGAVAAIAAQAGAVLGQKHLDAVGHRVVHGGQHFSTPVLLTEAVVERLLELTPLAPLHNPASLAAFRAIQGIWPNLPQVAVFDTAFHRTMPESAWRYALPEPVYGTYGIRRYGFHGISVGFVTAAAARHLDTPVDRFNAIVAHVGNGASVTAIRNGSSVDTSMGFTPMSGLVMGTRAGDLDAGILLFLLRQGMDSQVLETILEHGSGLKALAGTTDVRSIEESAAAGLDSAQLALDIAAYRLAKYVGAYHVAVGGARALVFTGGIGEHSAVFRANVVGRLGALGLAIDSSANLPGSTGPRTISTSSSAFPVLVVPTDEERAIAEATAVLIRTAAGSP